MGNTVTGHTGLLALLGSPVSHSGSPACIIIVTKSSD